MRRRSWVTIAATSLLMVCAIALLYIRPVHAENRRWGANYFPNVPLVDQDGKTVHFYDDLIKARALSLT